MSGDCLPRTEVISYGVNFTFVEDEINQYIADIIKSEKIITICDDFDNPIGIEDYNINIPLDNTIPSPKWTVLHKSIKLRKVIQWSFQWVGGAEDYLYPHPV